MANKKKEQEVYLKYVVKIEKLVMKKGSIFQSGSATPPPVPPKP